MLVKSRGLILSLFLRQLTSCKNPQTGQQCGGWALTGSWAPCQMLPPLYLEWTPWVWGVGPSSVEFSVAEFPSSFNHDPDFEATDRRRVGAFNFPLTLKNKIKLENSHISRLSSPLSHSFLYNDFNSFIFYFNIPTLNTRCSEHLGGLFIQMGSHTVRSGTEELALKTLSATEIRWEAT